MNNREAFEAECELLPDGVTWGEPITPSIAKHIAALASQAQQPNAWQQAIDDELVNAHLGIAKDGITREEAKAELNKLIAWHIDVAKYFESQAQQTESRHLSIESAPKDGMLFLSWGKHSTIPTLTKYSSEYGWFESEDGVHLYNLVCWMPLPPAPEGEKE